MALPVVHKFTSVARHLGVSVDSLRKVADEHGFTIRIGRNFRLLESDVQKLMELCRQKEKAPVSFGEPFQGGSPTGRYVTERPEYRQVRTSAKMLKKL